MRTLILAAILLSSFALTACETTKGLGRDITNAGEAIDRKI